MRAALEVIHEAGDERGLRPDHDEADLVLARLLDHVAGGQALDAVAGDPRVTRGGEHLRRARPAQQCPDERVLPSASADDEYASSAQSAEMKSSTGIAERVS
jgi:hypothetical protein